MDDIVLHSSLTTEEIEDNFRDCDFFSMLLRGFEEALLPGTIVRERELDT